MTFVGKRIRTEEGSFCYNPYFRTPFRLASTGFITNHQEILEHSALKEPTLSSPNRLL
jgi:hypothetical protein